MNLTIENSWWNEGGLWQDRDLSKVKNSHLSYRPAVFSVDELQPEQVFTLRGPRRAGKTVSLKLLVADLIEKKNVRGREILWTTLDSIRTLSQMEEHLVACMEKYRPNFLFIDEVTSVTHWQKVLKKLVDTGVLGRTCVVMTGSSSYDLKKGSERLAGRKGNSENSDRVLLPMSYSEFVKQVPNKEHRKIEYYLAIGGFPFRVNDFIDSEGKLDPKKKLSVFDDVFFYEINRRGLDRNIALEILSRLSEVKSHAISYEGFVKPLSIAKDTLKKYLNALGDAFLLVTFFSYDTGRNRASIKKDKKFVWVDPALSYLAPSMNQGQISDEACRAEWALGIELLRRFEFRIWEGLSAPRNVFTWKSSGGNEIDYLVVDKNKNEYFPFEMKYQESVSDWDFQVMERAFHKGILVTKDFLKQRPKSKALGLKDFLLSK